MDKGGAILIRDVEGMKTPSGIGGKVKGLVKDLLYQGGSEKVHVLRGELVFPQELHEGGVGVGGGDQKRRSYYVLHEPHITAFCNAQEIAPLSENDYQLLAGVQSRENRYQLFLNDGLEWGSQLKVDNHVTVTLPSPNLSVTPSAVAAVRYVGPLPDQHGIQFGVEILEDGYKGKGSTNGFFREKHYFVCDEDCGLFVGLDRIHPIPVADSQSATPQPQGSTYQPPTQSLVHVQPPPTVKLGDQVVVHNKKGESCRGKVGWVGMQSGLRKFGYLVVGLTMDSKVNITDFEGVIYGLTHLFQSKKSHTLFVPASLVTVELSRIEESLTTAQIAREKKMSNVEVVQEQKKIMKEVQRADPSHKQCKALQYENATPSEMPTGEHMYEPIPGKQGGSDPGRLGVTHALVARPWQPGSTRPSSDGSIFPRVASNPAHSDPHNSQYSPEYRSPSVHSNQPPPFPPTTQTGHPQPNQQPNYPHAYYQNQPPLAVNHVQPQGIHPQGIHPQGVHPQGVHPQGVQPQGIHPQGVQPQGIHPQGVQPQGVQSQGVQPQGVPPHSMQPPAGHTPSHFTVAPPGQASHLHLEVGSVVEVTTTAAPRYGVVRWTGVLPNVSYNVAGIELEDELEGCTDGTWQGTGERFFECPTGRAFFCPSYSLKPDTRFEEPEEPQHPRAAMGTYRNPLEHIPLNIKDDQGFGQTRIPSVEKYRGDERGIQGHQNSCYLDATIFGLFALSDVFDSLFLRESKDEVEENVKHTLWTGIVNPLRKNGAVRYESVMKLREQLDKLGRMKGVAQDEKDPEEFLNMLFKHTLHVPAFITIQRPQGKEGEFFVQLFMEPFESLRLPSIDILLRRMFKEQNIKFGEVPSKLLIQVPRYGKQFKAFEKIIPNLRMSIDDLCASISPEKSVKTAIQCNIMDATCFICDGVGTLKCLNCKIHFNSLEECVYFCVECSEKVHQHSKRLNHATEEVAAVAATEAVELELLSVLCIETSHYVCFTRFNDRWIFMDSMADRKYNMYNIPRGVEVTDDLKEWVYSGNEERLKKTPVRNLPQYVRRFTQDIYMCVYIQPDFDMYV